MNFDEIKCISFCSKELKMQIICPNFVPVFLFLYNLKMVYFDLISEHVFKEVIKCLDY